MSVAVEIDFCWMTVDPSVTKFTSVRFVFVFKQGVSKLRIATVILKKQAWVLAMWVLTSRGFETLFSKSTYSSLHDLIYIESDFAMINVLLFLFKLIVC